MAKAQVSADCTGAIVLCSDTTVYITGASIGVEDFANPNNDPGCLETIETRGRWFYFEFDDDMPPNSSLEFILTALEAFPPDYDFALYGPGLSCDSLGSPVRCSFTWFVAGPATGLASGYTDTTETFDSDGFLAPLQVQPGEGYYLFINDFWGQSDGFDFDFGGSAADYLNCNANPFCNLMTANAGSDSTLCNSGNSFQLIGASTYTNGSESYHWRGAMGEEVFLDDPNTASPAATFPDGFSDTIIYILEVQNGDCIASDTLQLIVLPAPVPAISGADTICSGETAILDAGPGFDSYLWSTGDTIPETRVSSPGTYSITVTGANGCPAADTVQVVVTPLPEPGLPDAAAACVDSTVVLAAAGTFESYSWSNAQSSPEISVSQPGWYYLSVTDANGCEGVDSVLVQQLLPPALQIQADYFACPGEAVTVDGPPGMAAYLWSTNESASSISLSTPGDYGLTITDANGCQASAAFSMQHFPAPTVDISGPASFCQGGAATLDAGAGFSTYQWQDNSAGQQLTAGSPGIYSVTVTDANGCTGADTLQLTQLSLPAIDIPASLSFCEGGMLAIDAGPGYTDYSWSDNSNGQSLQVNQPGVYGITVTDANGCQNSMLIDVSELPGPDINLTGDLFFCPGGSTTLTLDTAGLATFIWPGGGTSPTETFDSSGSYILSAVGLNGCASEYPIVILELAPTLVSISGDSVFCQGNNTILDAGLGYVSYQWSTGDSSNSIVVDGAGAYSVTVTNALGCPGQDTLMVAIQPPPSVALPDTAALCENGLLLLDAGGGLAGYQWSTGDNTQTIEVDQAGLYELSVFDSLGCIAQASVEVVEVEVPVPSINGDLSLCPGQESTLTVSDTYTSYLWSTGDTLATTTVTQSGFYILTVTDAAGCQGTANILVNEAPGITVDITGAQDFCEGGSALLSAGSHTSYHWSDGSTGPQLLVTESGQYSITVANLFGCTASDTVSIEVFPLPNLGLPAEISICEGDTASLQAPAGFSAYQWQGAPAGPSLAVDAPGWYYLLATDANNCAGQDSVLVVLSAAPNPEISGSLSLCPGDTTTLAAASGFASYQWSTGDTLSGISVWETGPYSLTVTDSAGCQGTANALVAALPTPVLEISGGNAFCEGSSLILDAGLHDSYSWSDGSMAPQLEVETPGEYSVTVANAQGCTASDTVQVGLFPPVEAAISGESLFCEGGSATLTASGSSGSYSWSSGGTGPSIEVNQSGTYSLYVTDASGCMDTATIEVTTIPLPIADAGPAQSIDCRTEVVTLGNAAAPANGFFYQWSGPGINSSNQHLPRPSVGLPGLYSLAVTDSASNCVSALSEVMVEDMRYEPPAVANAEGRLDCVTPVALVNGQGSAEGPAYVYQWYQEPGTPIPNANGLVLGALQPGLYTLVVLDTITGCTAQAQAEVAGSFDSPQADAGPGGLLTCAVEQLALNGSGNQGAGWETAWATTTGNIVAGASTLSPLVDQPGWYFLSITDPSNGCQGTDSVFVQQDVSAPIADAGARQQLDCTVEETMLDGTASSQGPGYSYLWVSENGFTASGTLLPVVTQGGHYVLTVASSENGCSSSDTVEVIAVDNYLTGLNMDISPPLCFGQNNGAVTISGVQGGTPPYLYSFDGAPFSSLQSFSQLGAGRYEARVQDALGCEYTAEVFLPEGNSILLELGENQEIELGEDAWLHAITNLGPEEIASFRWTPGAQLPCDTCLLVRTELPESTVFKATIVDTNGCSATDVLSIIVRKDREVYIPNAFSPNGDGFNDEFVVFAGADVVRIKHLSIHDRWGGLVFDEADFPPNNPTFGWNGTRDGQLFDPAVFAYMVEIEFVDGETVLYKGDVHLIR